MRHLFSFVTILGSFALQAQTYSISYSAALACGTNAQGYLRPRVQVNVADQPVVLWGRLSPAANFSAVGNGSMFSSAVMIHPMGVAPAVMDWMGSSLAAEGNTIWAVLKAAPEDVAHCYVVRSDDGGYTWGDTLRADADNGLISRFPSIAVVPGAGPIVQYMQFNSGFDEAHYVARRMMGGAFMPPVPVSEPFAPGYVCDCCPGQVEVSGSTVVGLYRNAGPNIRVIWGGCSTDAGAAFTSGAELDATNWMLMSCPSSGPDGYIAGDSLRYVWMSGAGNVVRVYLRSAHLPDLTPGPQRLIQTGLGSGASQNYPRIAGGGDTLGVVWEHYGNGNSAILFSHSITGISAMSAPDTLALGGPGQMGTPDIAYANGSFHIVWSDESEGVVRYRRAILVNSVGLSEQPAGPGLQVLPSPAGDDLFVNLSGVRGIQLLDAFGRVVLTSTLVHGHLDVSSVATGSYLLVAALADGRAASAHVTIAR